MRVLLTLTLATCFTAVAAGAQASEARESQPDYRARTIYFLMADRFNPHQPYDPYVDPEYPDATNSVNCFVVLCTQEQEFRSYWGGDIQGILQKTDYLSHLGVSAVWVAPLMENVRDYGAGKGYGTGYHGYWIQNYYRVNAHFGSWADVNTLSRTLHAKGMRYIQDITLNHSNPNDYHVYGRLFQSSTADQIFINSYDDDYDPQTGQRYYKHFEGTSACIDATTKSDADWTYWQLHHCLLADLSGYNQRDQAMANYLVGAGKRWLDNGVDDFRLDAVKFPFPEFIVRFTHAMEDHLESLHRPAPYIVGEWSNGGVDDESNDSVGGNKSLRFANNYDLFQTNILDFQLSFRLNRFIGGSYEDSTQLLSATGLDQYLRQRVIDFEGRDTWQGTFLDNHDEIRTLGRLKIIGVSDEAERRQRMDLGSVLLMTVRGIPIIYYGDEQYLVYYDADQTQPPDVNSGNDDPYNRIGLNRWDETTPAFKIIRALAELRRESPAIWEGKYVPIYSNQDILVFERISKGEVVLIAVNRGQDATITLPIPIGMKGGVYRGVLEEASGANHGNYLQVRPQGSTIHLNKLSSLVVAQ
jgi:cyclomaltodextrin glucanotransferase